LFKLMFSNTCISVTETITAPPFGEIRIQEGGVFFRVCG
jgi:hypothetical protein